MLRRLFSLGARIFVALVMIGLISQQITNDSVTTAPGPKFVKPGGDPASSQADEGMTFQKMLDLAAAAARDMLGSGEEAPPKSSLEQLHARNKSLKTY